MGATDPTKIADKDEQVTLAFARKLRAKTTTDRSFVEVDCPLKTVWVYDVADEDVSDFEEAAGRFAGRYEAENPDARVDYDTTHMPGEGGHWILDNVEVTHD